MDRLTNSSNFGFIPLSTLNVASQAPNPTPRTETPAFPEPQGIPTVHQPNEPSGDRMILFMQEVSNGNLEAVKSFVAQPGVNINYQLSKEQDWTTPTALHIAVKAARMDIAEVLLNAGANIEAKNYLEETALHLAVDGGHLPLVRLLIKKGAKLDATDQINYTPIKIATAKRLNHIRLLLETQSVFLSIQKKIQQLAKAPQEKDAGIRLLFK